VKFIQQQPKARVELSLEKLNHLQKKAGQTTSEALETPTKRKQGSKK
jgi:hypothetical protein